MLKTILIQQKDQIDLEDLER